MGLPDGEYDFGGEDDRQGTGGKAPNRFLWQHADLLQAVQNAYKFAQLSLCEAVRAASLNPAQAIGPPPYGSIEVGKAADLVAIDSNFRCTGRTWLAN